MEKQKRRARACFASHTGYFVSYPAQSTKVEAAKCEHRSCSVHSSSAADSHLHWPKHYLNQNKKKS